MEESERLEEHDGGRGTEKIGDKRLEQLEDEWQNWREKRATGVWVDIK